MARKFDVTRIGDESPLLFIQPVICFTAENFFGRCRFQVSAIDLIKIFEIVDPAKKRMVFIYFKLESKPS
ncbi:hypothetical protein XB05_13680 [Xanthomonas arboricola]|nr:hypothetical protein XB05_13680 [Xanthomonas arboricola]